jgi:hypothetical protein
MTQFDLTITVGKRVQKDPKEFNSLIVLFGMTTMNDYRLKLFAVKRQKS